MRQDLNPKTFCILPWVHSAINPDGTVRPCCMTTWGATMGTLSETTTLKDIFNSNEYKEIRKEMLSGKLPDACKSCKIQEDANTESYRQHMNAEFADAIDKLNVYEDGSADYQQLYIDYRFTNKCNFKCITCGSALSSSIAVEEIKIRKKTDPRAGENMPPAFLEVNGFLDQLRECLPTISRIYFAGGEPLIADQHYEILQMLIDSKKPITITYNTNLSNLNYRGYDVIEMWRQLNGRVVIGASVDGFDKAGETIRFGFDTEVFKANINKILDAKLPNVHLNFNITYGTTNYKDVVATSLQLTKLMPNQGLYINYNPIFYSYEFSLHILTHEQLDNAVVLIEQQIEDSRDEFLKHKSGSVILKQLENDFLRFVKSAKNSTFDKRKEYIKYAIERMDSKEEVRGTNWRRDLPNMWSDWQQILNSDCE